MSLLQAMADKYDGVECGYVYVMEFRFRKGDGYKTLYKVGVTINKPIDRMLQISRSFFMGRRYVPECSLVRFRNLPNYYQREKTVHTRLEEFNYKFKTGFDGSTEFFDIPLDDLLAIYEEECPLIKKEDRI
jgi:hypothetical protein